MALLRQTTASTESKSGGGSRKQRKTMDRFKKSRKRSGGCSNSEYDDPPILNITIDDQDYVDVPVRRKNEPDASKEFAIAAKDAVKTQIESGEQSCSQLSPLHMAPTDELEVFRSAEVHEIMLDRELPYAGNTVRITDLAAKHSGEHGCLIFVIRRPGCKLCREQALFLKFLFQNYPKEVLGFNVVGIVKEFCDVGDSLLDFHENYFPFPLYHDDQMTFYKALGSRKVSLGTTFKLLNPFSDISKRLKKNGIKGNFAGEGFVQGGVIIFRQDGEPAFKYEEETGLELPVSDIATALDRVRRGHDSNTRSSTGSPSKLIETWKLIE